MKLRALFESDTGRDENYDLYLTPPPGELGNFITSAQRARELGVTMSRIRQFIMQKRLKRYKPEKGRRDNLLKMSDVKEFQKKDRRISGRPTEKKKKRKSKKSKKKD